MAGNNTCNQPTHKLTISRMADPVHYNRFVEPLLEKSLADSPVVLIHGPRQCGKTTLVRGFGEARGYAYFSFDDLVVLRAATEDPAGFVASLPRRVILDEVQRVPTLFTSLKLAVDRDRTPGRFLVTGSANVLLVPRLADSLAGRMEILRLHPLSQAELLATPPTFLDRLFGRGFLAGTAPRLAHELPRRIAAGGYPVALARPEGARRARWHRDYVETIVQRDVLDLARIRDLDALARLVALVAGQTARLLNVSDLAGPFELSRQSVRNHVTLLERVFLVDVIPPWHSSRLPRLVRTPKVHLGDTGLACALLGVDSDGLAADRGLLGQLLETFVVQELRRQASWRDEAIRFFHFRDRDGVEVDLVLERGAREVAGIEVKAGATVSRHDFSGLRKLQAGAGDRFMGGVMLYDGETSVAFGDRLFAIPLRHLWEPGDATRGT